MEPKPYTQSVIAKLMGLDEMPLQQPVHTRKRVLSENYLRKTASIGLREKRPVKEGHSFSTNTEKEQDFKAVLGMSEMFKKVKEKSTANKANVAFGTRRFEDQSKALNKVPEDLNVDKEAFFSYLLQRDNSVTKPDLRSFIISSTIEKTNAPRNILRLRQKLENGFATEHYGDYRLPTKIVILKPKPVKVTSDINSSSPLSSQSGNSVQEFSSRINLKENSRKNEIITQKSRPTISSNYSAFAREAKERLSDRWKMTKVAQEVGTVSCKATLSEMLSVPDLEVGPGTLKNKLDEHAPKTGNTNLSCTLLTSSNLGHLVENHTSINSVSGPSTPNGSNVASSCTVINVMGDSDIENVELASGDSTKKQSTPVPGDVFVRDGYSPCFIDGSDGQESQNRSHEYAVDSSDCTSPGETYQPSPNSVLEPPFKEDVSPVYHCTDLQGLWMELQLLKSDSEKTISEGTGMIISSDGDTTEKSFHSSSKNENLTKFLREGESRDFSYLQDILKESGLHGGPTIINIDSWHSPERLLSPSLFEELEKKYIDHTSWNKEERKLLFDRVNAGLMEILKPWLDVHIYEKPLRKKVGNALKRDLIEEELWSLLVREGTEAKKELSEKAVGRESWVEFWDEVETIATDIENFLFNQLVDELVSI